MPFKGATGTAPIKTIPGRYRLYGTAGVTPFKGATGMTSFKWYYQDGAV